MAGPVQSDSRQPKREERSLKHALLLLAAVVSLPTMADEQPDLYGRYELVNLPALGKTLKAEQDTLYEHPLVRIAEIKKRSEEGAEAGTQEVAYSQRPVIEMPVCLGGEQRNIEVNLTDRSTFSYPLLIGASAMREFGVAVDPAARYTRDR